MSNKYIDVDKFLERLADMRGDLSEEPQYDEGYDDCLSEIEMMIKYNLPISSFGDVVLCKDCKHLRIDKDFQSGRRCAIRNVNGGGFCDDNDFCSYGEKV